MTLSQKCVSSNSKSRHANLQVTDISQYGDIAAAQSVLVPPGCKVVDKSTFKIPQPPRNTGTLAGVVKVPPSTIYRYYKVRAHL